MDFDFTLEQTQLKDSVERMLARLYPNLESRQALASSPLGFSLKGWEQFAELGLLGLSFAEEDGGFGGGPVETFIVMQAIGRTLAVEPYFASAILGATALRLAGTAAQRARLVPDLTEGCARLAFAHHEKQARYAGDDVTTVASTDADTFRLNGHKTLVLNGDAATHLIVSALLNSGLALFLVDAKSSGVTMRAVPTQDGRRVADIMFDAALAEHLPDGDATTLAHIGEHAIAALAAEAVGAMDALHALTVDYLRTRRQFGTAIAAFQVLQHRAVDMFIEIEQARSMAYYAAMMLNHSDAAERAVAMAAVKVQINRACRFVGQEAVQLHGGIGMTAEYVGAHLFKRLAMIEREAGDTPHHLQKVAEAGGLIHA